jgi:hypothetical protein
VLSGVNLTLMIGPLVPIPVPREALDALASVEVTNRDLGASTFQISFTLSNQSPLETIFLLSGGGPLLFLRVVIVVTVNGTANVIMDGVITNHQIAPGTNKTHSTLVITGEDLTALMNQMNLSGFPFPATPPEGRVALLLAKWAFLGIIPLIIPSIMISEIMPTEAIPAQQGTDLAYIQALADQVGYVFYLDPGPWPGASRAYWGPLVKAGTPQPALGLDMDAASNVESLSFNFDSQKNKIPTVFIYNEESGVTIPIPIPPITPLNPPLGLIPPLPTSLADLQPVADDLAKRPVPEAILIGMSKAAQWADAVTGQGSLDVVRYGQPLKARGLVGVRGAGPAFDGLHYVRSVTHKIKPGEYKQSFELSRNGLLSTVQTVTP